MPHKNMREVFSVWSRRIPAVGTFWPREERTKNKEEERPKQQQRITGARATTAQGSQGLTEDQGPLPGGWQLSS